MQETTPKGFLSALYDLSFHSFVTPKIIQIVYVIVLLGWVIFCLGFLVSGFMPTYTMFGSSSPSVESILAHLLLTPILFVLGSIAARMYLEFVVAVFRIAENTESMRSR